MPAEGMSDCLSAGRACRWPDRSASVIKDLSYRFRAALLLFIVLGLAATVMAGCALAGIESGVFIIDTTDGAVELIGEPAGIPVWSPKDDMLAWGNEDGLFIKGLHEPSVRLVAAGSVAGIPAWSPDGKKLAYVDRNRSSLVVIVAASGAEQFSQPLDRQTGTGTRFALLTLGGPSWAPDGSRIAYSCWDGAGDEICVIQADGTNWQQVTRLKRRQPDSGSATPQLLPAESNVGPPAWSPRGTYLAVAVYPERPGAPSGVFLVEPEVGLARRVSSLQPDSVISWFPDGGSILFSAFRQGRSDAIRVVLPTTSMQTLTAGLPQGSRNPALSPDGSQIAVETGGGIAVLSKQEPVQGFSVPGLRSSYPAWGNEGASIAVSADTDPIAIYN
jgi:Tol biopolymer transport system component